MSSHILPEQFPFFTPSLAGTHLTSPATEPTWSSPDMYLLEFHQSIHFQPVAVDCSTQPVSCTPLPSLVDGLWYPVLLATLKCCHAEAYKISRPSCLAKYAPRRSKARNIIGSNAVPQCSSTTQTRLSFNYFQSSLMTCYIQ